MTSLLRAMLFLLFVLSSTVSAQVSLMCADDNLLFKPIDLNNVTKGIEVSANNSTVSDKNHYQLTGDAVLQSPDYYLKAQQVDYLKDEKQFSAVGDVHFQNDSLLITADNVKSDDSTINLNNINYQFSNQSAQGSAEKATLTSQQVVTLHNATYSTCPLNKSSWRMKASKVELDNNTSYGSADHVVLMFKDIPVLYLPSINWVLKGRKTGLLIPSFNTYSSSDNDESGTQIRVPYYVNIANDKDLLLTMNYLSSRGESLESSYRQLFKKGNLALSGGYLDEDEQTNEKRWFSNVELHYDVTNRVQIDISTKQVSDEAYLQDIAHENQTLRSLESNGSLSYQNNGFELSLSAQTQQAVNSASATYYRLPEVKAKKQFTLTDGSNVTAELMATKFRHHNQTLVNGERIHSLLSYDKKISQSSYSIHPTLSTQSTQYILNTDDETDLRKSRDIYSAQLDSHLLLEKTFKQTMVHTIKPRLYYVYTNKKEQLDLPMFDTAIKPFSYSTLFSPSQFSGVDRINRANDFALGLESDLINHESGKQIFDIRIGQRFYQDDRINSVTSTLVDSDAINGYDGRKYSDIAAELTVYMGDYQLINQLRWDPENNDVKKRTTALNYQQKANHFFTLAHHKIDDENILESTLAYPFNADLHLIASLNKSLSHNRLKKSSLGLIYDSCCWAFKAVHFQEYSGDDDGSDEFDRVTKLEFVFKGLGSTTPDTNNMIRSYIPDYHNE